MGNIFHSFEVSNNKRKLLQEKNALSYKEASKERLSRIIKKKFNTAIIGSIDSIETHLGYLWRHGENIPDNHLTRDELQFKNLWAKLRNEILTKGNNQLRAALLEITEYEVDWKKKEYNGEKS